MFQEIDLKHFSKWICLHIWAFLILQLTVKFYKKVNIYIVTDFKLNFKYNSISVEITIVKI